jgi:hypothetical protein
MITSWNEFAEAVLRPVERASMQLRVIFIAGAVQAAHGIISGKFTADALMKELEELPEREEFKLDNERVDLQAIPFTIQHDGKTVWVNSPTKCVARFGRHAWEVGSITHSMSDLDLAWQQFQAAVFADYCIVVPDDFKPQQGDSTNAD